MSDQPRAAAAPVDVSVVIGVFNGEPYIAETLDSILAQEGVTCEIIVVDDGSTDGTGDVVRRFGDKVQYLHTPASGGPSKPRNIGCRLATGEFIATFDADDLMLPGKLKSQADALRAHPELVCVLTDYRNFTAEGPETITHFDRCDVLRAALGDDDDLVVLQPAVAREILTLENFSITGSLFFRRQAFLDLGPFDEELGCAEDYDLIYRSALTHPIGVLRRVGFARRLHDNNISLDASRNLRLKSRARRKLAGLEPELVFRKRLMDSASSYQLNLVVEQARHGHPFNSVRAMLTRRAIRHLFTPRGLWALAWCLLGLLFGWVGLLDFLEMLQ
jgi:glycosyltransferase involved in cell wall biosynthesis